MYTLHLQLKYTCMYAFLFLIMCMHNSIRTYTYVRTLLSILHKLIYIHEVHTYILQGEVFHKRQSMIKSLTF